MHVVIFEVAPKPEHWDAYLAHAAALRPELLRIDGFIANDRYRSRTREGWLVSLSTWRDAAAVLRWRTHGGHRAVQADGRARVFADYRLRVGVVADDDDAAAEAGATTADPARAALLIEGGQDALDAAQRLTGALPGALAIERFDAILDPGQGLLLGYWPDAAPDPPPLRGFRVRRIRILRSYGLRDRAEVPADLRDPDAP
ncbi:MAG: antibiotic biosynthesis monooxygenase [Rhodospirillales bacterium]|nr:antibiotic biosynthesis monooxygenase [Rhodospirillales bacterium]